MRWINKKCCCAPTIITPVCFSRCNQQLTNDQAANERYFRTTGLFRGSTPYNNIFVDTDMYGLPSHDSLVDAAIPKNSPGWDIRTRVPNRIDEIAERSGYIAIPKCIDGVPVESFDIRLARGTVRSVGELYVSTDADPTNAVGVGGSAWRSNSGRQTSTVVSVDPSVTECIWIKLNYANPGNAGRYWVQWSINGEPWAIFDTDEYTDSTQCNPVILGEDTYTCTGGTCIDQDGVVHDLVDVETLNNIQQVACTS